MGNISSSFIVALTYLQYSSRIMVSRGVISLQITILLFKHRLLLMSFYF